MAAKKPDAAKLLAKKIDECMHLREIVEAQNTELTRLRSRKDKAYRRFKALRQVNRALEKARLERDLARERVRTMEDAWLQERTLRMKAMRQEAPERGIIPNLKRLFHA